MILSLNTAQPEAELALEKEGREVAKHKWLAGRELSRGLLPEIEMFLRANHVEWEDLTGIKVFQGPGSFTGLRIGHSVANALAYSLGIKVSNDGKNWHKQVVPEYGAPANITLPKAK